MANSQSVALASLTATYTDSENEDHDTQDSNVSDHSSKDIEESHTPPLPLSSLEIGVGLTKKAKYANLVSYNDDLVISEDENEGDGEKSLSTEDLTEKDDIQLPPEPTGRCSNELQDKIVRLHDKMVSNGLDMNKIIQQRKDFRNPSIYEKLIQFCSINEFGTNYPPEVYDPIRWGPESYYEELAKVQKAEMDRREKERKEKTKVEFVVGTVKRMGGTSSNPGSGTDDDSKRRKSKWDQVGLTAAQLMLKPMSLPQPTTLTTSATGTKGTVISAFGSLPKKPRM